MPELHFSRQGEGDPLILLHGLFGSGKNWQSLARVLANHFEVINIDQRNHGQSFHADSMNYPDMAADVAAVLRRLELGACHILGHSMGGKVAMMLAARHPEMVARLIVADIAPVSYLHNHDNLIDPIFTLPLSQIASRTQADQILSEQISDAQLRAFLLQNLIRDANGWRWRVNWRVIQREMSQLTGFSGLAANWIVEQPSLFIRGARSDYVGVAEIDAIQAHFINPEIQTIDDAGHWLHTEQPRTFTHLVLNFLQPQ